MILELCSSMNNILEQLKIQLKINYHKIEKNKQKQKKLPGTVE